MKHAPRARSLVLVLVLPLLVAPAAAQAGPPTAAAADREVPGTPSAPPSAQEPARPGYLGVRVGAGPAGRVLVERVEPGTPAARAGLRSGDRLLAVDGDAVASPDDVVAAIGRRAPGAVVALRVAREGAELTLEAELAARPEPEPRAGRTGAAEREAEAQRLSDELLGRHGDELARWRDELRRRHRELLERTERHWEPLWRRAEEPGWEDLRRRLAEAAERRRERLQAFLERSEVEDRALVDELRRWLEERHEAARRARAAEELGWRRPGEAPEGEAGEPGAAQHRELEHLRAELERLRAEVHDLRRQLEAARAEDDPR